MSAQYGLFRGVSLQRKLLSLRFPNKVNDTISLFAELDLQSLDSLGLDVVGRDAWLKRRLTLLEGWVTQVNQWSESEGANLKLWQCKQEVFNGILMFGGAVKSELLQPLRKVSLDRLDLKHAGLQKVDPDAAPWKQAIARLRSGSLASNDVALYDKVGDGDSALHVKWIPTSDWVDVQIAFKEAAMYSNVSGDHILPYKGTTMFIFPSKLSLKAPVRSTKYFVAHYFPYSSAGSLKHGLVTSKPLSASFKPELCRQVLQSVGYLHKKGCIHGNISAENFMLDNQWKLKLTEFGYAFSEMRGAWRDYDVAGIRWRPPELAVGGSLSKASDVWQTGMVIAEVYGLLPPTTEKLVDVNLERLLASAVVEGGEHIARLLGKMLCVNPGDRMSVDALLKSIF